VDDSAPEFVSLWTRYQPEARRYVSNALDGMQQAAHGFGRSLSSTNLRDRLWPGRSDWDMAIGVGMYWYGDAETTSNRNRDPKGAMQVPPSSQNNSDPMKHRFRILFAAVVALSAAILSAVPAVADSNENTRPNIVIFYVDDLGWQDVEKLNDMGDPCPYETPNLIKLAARGMNFPQAYSPAPTCAPSRAGILTGQHPAKLGYTHVTAANIPQPTKTQQFHEPFLGAHLGLDHVTLADALNQNGYRTGHFGKWHCGLNATAFGFDEVNQTRGVHRGMGDRTKDFATAEDKTYPLSKEKYAPFSNDFPDGISYPHDELTESAIDFIRDNKNEPFFLNLCHWMVHWPVLTRNGELLEYYCKKMGQPFPPKPGDMRLEGQQNPYFASMVTTVDWSLGRVIDYLEVTDDPRNPGKKLIDTTYIFFTSDNGGAEIRGREIISDNFPLKAGKKYVDEGGIRVPLVVTGPGIAAASESNALVNQLDFYPTILSLTSTKIPGESMGKLSGLDIRPILVGQSHEVVDRDGKPRESLFWHFPHNGMKAAIRKGDFKLYRHFQTETYSLYRLYDHGKPADIEEQHDLRTNPEYASAFAELSAELNQSLEENNAILPHRNPFYSEATIPSARIANVIFNKNTATASVTLTSDSPKATSAYILYLRSNDTTKPKKSADYSQGDPEVRYQVKIPAVIGGNGFNVSANVPTEVTKVRFLIVDENNYQHFTEPTTAK